MCGVGVCWEFSRGSVGVLKGFCMDCLRVVLGFLGGCLGFPRSSVELLYSSQNRFVRML